MAGDRPTRELPASVRDLAVLRGEVEDLRHALVELREERRHETARVILGAEGGVEIEVVFRVVPLRSPEPAERGDCPGIDKRRTPGQ